MRLASGDKLRSIFWPGEDSAELSIGTCGCVSLTVFTEAGQMAAVPWVRAEYKKHPTACFNVALLEGYTRLPDGD